MAENLHIGDLEQEDDQEEEEKVQTTGTAPLKKPQTAYSLFIQDTRSEMKEEMAAKSIK